MMDSRWDRHFIRLCEEHARMSKDPSTKVGAVIVGPDRDIRSMGFNGFPRGIADTSERLKDRETKLGLIVHAECNAIVQAARVGIPIAGCTLYLAAVDAKNGVWGGPPCLRCTVHIIQSGIVEVVSLPRKAVPLKWYRDLLLSQAALKEARIRYREIEA